MSDAGRSVQSRRGLGRTLRRILRVMGPGGPSRNEQRGDAVAATRAGDDNPAGAPSTGNGDTNGAAPDSVPENSRHSSPEAAPSLETAAPTGTTTPASDAAGAGPTDRPTQRHGAPADGSTSSPPLSPISQLPAGSEPGPQPAAHLVDPLERTRAALADARRQMPGMLGDDPPPDAIDAPTGQRRPAPVGNPERMLSEWRAIVEQLQAERSQLASEVAELRELVADLRGDISRLVGMAGSFQLTIPQPANGGTTAPVAASRADLAAVQGLMQPSSATAAPPAAHEWPRRDADDSTAPPVPTQDFGWRFRPESLPPLETAGEWQPPEAADFEHDDSDATAATAGPASASVAATKPDATPPPGQASTGPAEVMTVRPEEDDPVAFVAGSTVLVIAGALQGVRQAMAIVSSLAALDGAGRVSLVSFRGREATCRLRLGAATTLDAVRQSVEASGAAIDVCSLDADGRTIRIGLSRVPGEAAGRA